MDQDLVDQVIDTAGRVAASGAIGGGTSHVRGAGRPAKRSAIHSIASGPATIAAFMWLTPPSQSTASVDPAAHHCSWSIALGQARTTSSAVPWAMKTGISAGMGGGVWSAMICAQPGASPGSTEKKSCPRSVRR